MDDNHCHHHNHHHLVDHFNRLPDEILLIIFNKTFNAKSLTQCLSVCKRFSSLIPQINSVFLSLPRPILLVPKTKSRTHMKNLLKLFIKPVKHFLHKTTSSSSLSSSNKSATTTRRTRTNPEMNSNTNTFHNALKKFTEMKSLHVQLPFSGNKFGGSGSFLKWKAEFGKNLNSCIILGGTDIYFGHKRVEQEQVEEEEEFLTDEELKLRVVWIISCLIAATTRHRFLKSILSSDDSNHCSNLESVTISDENKQGKIYMGKEQILEMKNSSSTVVERRTPVPELSIEMWYVPVLELPGSGCRIEGATLVVIKPVDGGGDLLLGEEDDDRVYCEGVKEMMRVKKSYLMTMNSF